MEKIYHIYAKDRCIYHSLSENKFSETWETIHRLVDLLGMDFKKDDFSYEELSVNKLISLTNTYIPDKIDLKVD